MLTSGNRFTAPVGLGIVAAMNEGGVGRSPSARSKPIPIMPTVAAAAAAAKHRSGTLAPTRTRLEEEDEGYTCVMSHVGGRLVRKRVYFDDGLDGCVFSNSPLPWLALPPLETDFLSCCYLCQKKLHGIDIYMYRGDEAFCSTECRSQQILCDEQQAKKWRSKAVKPLKLPSSPPLFLSASVAAA